MWLPVCQLHAPHLASVLDGQLQGGVVHQVANLHGSWIVISFASQSEKLDQRFNLHVKYKLIQLIQIQIDTIDTNTNWYQTRTRPVLNWFHNCGTGVDFINCFAPYIHLLRLKKLLKSCAWGAKPFMKSTPGRLVLKQGLKFFLNGIEKLWTQKCNDKGNLMPET